MRTVKEVSRITGVSVRTLHYYDQIGLLPPAETTESGYRLYDDKALERLQQIMLFRELEFSLKDIKKILSSPDFDRNKALEQQIALLSLQKDHIDALISLALEIKNNGGNNMNFKPFDKSEIESFSKEAKEKWGETKVYKDYEKKTQDYTSSDFDNANKELLNCFVKFGTLKNSGPESPEAQQLAAELQNTISRCYYKCDKTILASLGQMYTADKRFTATIDGAGGQGTAEFAGKAIAYYCKTDD